MTELRLVVFDVDGTLVDSQAHILAAMRGAFDSLNLPTPERSEVLGLVGLSLDLVIARLAPNQSSEVQAALVQGYKDAFVAIRQADADAAATPFYPGALDVLQALHAEPETLLGVATGKSRRGLDKILAPQDLSRRFVTQQVADHHPSKPHPSMLKACLDDTGVEAARAVMVGDTSYDMDMAKAAGLFAIGVSWGYHDVGRLTSADVIIDRFEDLHDVLEGYWG